MADPGLASKFVEMQMEDAERGPQRGRASHLSPLEVERRESVRLSIARTQQQLSRASHPKHKKMLRRALADLTAEL
jgi:hypothetical protein